jgi:hypothetical protein
MYGLTPYFLTKNMIDMPILFLQPLSLLLVVYWGVGYSNNERSFWMMYFTLMLTGQVAAGLGFLMSAACETMEKANQLSPLITLPAMLFGGLFVNTSTVFAFLSWIQWLSPIRYGFEALCIAEFKPRHREAFYQDQLGFGDVLNFWGCIYALLGLTIISRIISILVLKANIKKF